MKRKFLAWVMALTMLLSLLPAVGLTAGAEPQTQTNEDCITFTSDASFTLKVSNQSKTWDGEIYWNTDQSTWSQAWDGTEITAGLGVDGKYHLYLRGSTGNTKITGNNYGGEWVITSTTGHTVSCTGNIETLRGATGSEPSSTSMGEYCYFRMFFDCQSLTSAPALPATNLADYCYKSMFYHCTSLTSAPALPATALKAHCYEDMFGYTNIELTDDPSYKSWSIPAGATTATDWGKNMFLQSNGLLKNFNEQPEIGKIYYFKVTHTVTWMSQDGQSELEKDDTVTHDTQPSFDSTAPTKAEDDQYTYTFSGWATEPNQESGTEAGALPAVTENVTYYAAFSKSPKQSPGGNEVISRGESSRDRTPSNAVKTNTTGNGTVRSDKTFAIPGNAVTLTVIPAPGWMLDSITARDAKGNEVTLTEGRDGTCLFKMPDANVTVSTVFRSEGGRAEPMEQPEELEQPEAVEPPEPMEPSEATESTESIPPVSLPNPFADVQETDFFYAPVLWAVENGITGGVDENHFAPYDTSTRAQTITFLWRAAGSPEPVSTENSFTDVSESDYFYQAVLWGYENGYVKGTSETTFAPNDTVTRCQVVTFLTRVNGVSDEATGYAHTFTDVPADAYYSNAVAWAAQKGITNGTGENTFSPDNGCTRGEVVTFLHRDATL